MKNTLCDLNNHLFLELERLNDEELDKDNIQFECSRAKALSMISEKILANASLMLETRKHFDAMGESTNSIPKILRISDKTE